MFRKIIESINNIAKELSNIGQLLNLINNNLANISETLEFEVVEETDEVNDAEFDWMEWWNLTNFPQEIDGMKVGYVSVEKDVPLYIFKLKKTSNGDVAYDMQVFEDVELRENSSFENVNSMRIRAKQGKILMVYANGSLYELSPYPWYEGDKSIRPFIGDGGNAVFLIMHEQIIDGINLWESRFDSIFFGIYASDIAKVGIQG